MCYDIENNIKLDHLQPGTRYYYRVCVQEILHKSAYANHFGGDTLRTRFYSFRTPGDDGDFGCLVFNDLHDQSKTYGRSMVLNAPSSSCAATTRYVISTRQACTAS